MWTRSELKARAKASIKANYWQCLLVCIIIAILAGNFISVKYNVDYNQFYLNVGTSTSYFNRTFMILTALSATVLAILGIIYRIFILNPLSVGKARYFLENREEPSTLDTLLFTFRQKDYLNIVAILFLSDLFIFLWSFLLIIPGIIKAFEYSQIEYILAENPGLSSKRVFQMTREMTMGNKWDIFVLGLSFIGWNILSVFTCGIVGVAIMPYYEATFAELYITLRDEYIDAGYAGFEEFPGFYR